MNKASMPGAVSDPSFASAVEGAYLRALSSRGLEPGEVIDGVHSELFACALYAADPTNGGLRFKKLDGGPELEARLRRALAMRSDSVSRGGAV